MRIKDILELVNKDFIKAGIDNYFYETREILSFTLGKSKEWIMSNIDYEIDELMYEKFLDLASKRIEGVPLQYILGEAYFMGLKFVVNNDVLIPRADTEILVYKIIELANKFNEIKLLDLCTGSGCISISLAKKLSNAKVFASDISKNALLIAKENSKINETNITFFESNLFENIEESKFDIIVSNPPYITGEEMKKLEKDVLNEPHLALYGGEDGLKFYREISKKALNYLKINGILAFEIGYNQAEAVFSILTSLNYKDIEVIKDYSGNDRVIIARK